jgi:NNP family nitrate/nitrite transporter-like MFS transporter
MKPSGRLSAKGFQAAPQSSGFFTAQLAPLLLLTSIFFINFVARISISPLTPEIEASLHLTHLQAGSLFLVISTGYFTGLLGAGWMVARVVHRRAVFVSSLVLAIAMIGTVFSQTLVSLRVLLFLVGIASGIYLPSGIAIISELIESRHLGKAYAIHELAPNLALVAAPLLAEAVMIWFSWRAVPVLIGAVMLAAAFGFAHFGRGGDFKGNPPGIAAFQDFFIDPAFWIMTILFALGISSTLGVYTMLPLFLVTEHGLDREVANTVVALSRISGLFMALAGGWASDRFGPRKVLVIVFLLTGSATILMGAAPNRWVLAAVFFQPLLAVCFFPAGFAALSRIGPTGSRNLAVSLAIPIAFLLGGGAVPSLIGLLGDTVSFSAGIMLVGAAITAGALLAGQLKLQ